MMNFRLGVYFLNSLYFVGDLIDLVVIIIQILKK